MKEKHPLAVEDDQHVGFYFTQDEDYIELILDAKQKESFCGWKIQPHKFPCKV